MPRYLNVRWHHDDPDDPVRYLSEIEQGDEVRKVERYADGRVGWAGPDGSGGGSELAQGPIPNEDEIAADPVFTVDPTSAEEFEREWCAARAATRSAGS